MNQVIILGVGKKKIKVSFHPILLLSINMKAKKIDERKKKKETRMLVMYHHLVFDQTLKMLTQYSVN